MKTELALALPLQDRRRHLKFWQENHGTLTQIQGDHCNTALKYSWRRTTKLLPKIGSKLSGSYHDCKLLVHLTRDTVQLQVSRIILVTLFLVQQLLSELSRLNVFNSALERRM